LAQGSSLGRHERDVFVFERARVAMVGRIRDPSTGAVLRASGKKDSRNEDRDANPLNDSIPGEVVRRNEKAHKSGPSAKALAETDLQAVLAKGSGTREKWLKKALQQVQEGDLSAADVYNILKVPDFASDLKDKTGKSMYKFLMSRISVFSKGQQRFLQKECSLAQLFGGEGGQGVGSDEVKMPNSAEPNPEAAEQMMARVREFVRQQQGVELDQAVSAVPEPVAPPPLPRQDTSAVASMIARAASTAVSYQAARAAWPSEVSEMAPDVLTQARNESEASSPSRKVKKSKRPSSSSPSSRRRRKESRSRSRGRRRR